MYLGTFSLQNIAKIILSIFISYLCFSYFMECNYKGKYSFSMYLSLVVFSILVIKVLISLNIL